MQDNPTKKCAFFWRGGCKNGWKCRYSHIENIARGICQLPGCKYQRVKHYEHKSPSHWNSTICTFYERNVCAFAHKCYNIHRAKRTLPSQNKGSRVPVLKTKESQLISNVMEKIQEEVKMIRNLVHNFEAKISTLSAAPKKTISVKLKKSKAEGSKNKKRKRNHFKIRKKLKSLENENEGLRKELLHFQLSINHMENNIEEIRSEICVQKNAENFGTKDIKPKKGGEDREKIQTIKHVHSVSQEVKECEKSSESTNTRNHKEKEVDNSVNEGQMKNEQTDKKEMEEILKDSRDETKDGNESDEMEYIANKHFFQPFNCFMALQGKKSTK